LKVETITLPIEQFCAFVQIDLGDSLGARDNLKLLQNYAVDALGHQFMAVLRCPTWPIQDRIVCEYQPTLWDHIKARLGWKHRTTVVRFQELCAYPDMTVPPHVTKGMRIYRATDIATYSSDDEFVRS